MTKSLKTLIRALIEKTQVLVQRLNELLYFRAIISIDHMIINTSENRLSASFDRFFLFGRVTAPTV
jgi:predicted transcriptional regulator